MTMESVESGSTTFRIASCCRLVASEEPAPIVLAYDGRGEVNHLKIIIDLYLFVGCPMAPPTDARTESLDAECVVQL